MRTVRDVARPGKARQLLASMRQRLWLAARHFRTDRAGLAAIEFAMVLPVLLLFYLSAFEGSRGFSAGRKLSATTETVGNLVTRLSAVTDTDLANIFNISGAIMSQLPGAPTIVVTAVSVDANGLAKVAWSRKSTGNVGSMSVIAGTATGSAYTLPAELVGQKSTFFIDAKVTYDFRLIASYGGIISDKNMVRQNIFRPRVGDEIGWTS